MRRSSVKEYTETMRRHYTGASRTEKSRLLDELATTESRPSGCCRTPSPPGQPRGAADRCMAGAEGRPLGGLGGLGSSVWQALGTFRG